MRYILAIDQGTTSNTAMIVDERVRVVAIHSVPLPQHYPRQGWVEHNLDEIWQGVSDAAAGVIKKAGIEPARIEAIGLTNQRETTVLWDRNSARPLYNAIVWQCRRTSGICKQLRDEGLEELFRKKSGLLLDPYFSGTKIKWLCDNVDLVREKVADGSAAFGTIDSFVLWKLTGHKVHATDPSNASRTLLYNIRKGVWDEQLCRILELNPDILPEVKPNFSIFGYTSLVGFLPDGIPICALAGDQQAALYGQMCFSPGDAKCTYGTGAFLLCNTGGEVVDSPSGLLASVGWQKGDSWTYVLEGSSFTAGSAVQWLKEGLAIIDDANQVEELALRADSSSEVVFIPAFTGIGAPYWSAGARGAFFGITPQTTAAELAKAVLEGIAMQIVELKDTMEKDYGRKINYMKVDGGAVRNDLLMQMQSDLAGCRIIRPSVTETTALGVALMAGITAGLWKDEKELAVHWKEERVFSPTMDDQERERVFFRWKRALKACMSVAFD